jgi:hypothetical protein
MNEVYDKFGDISKKTKEVGIAMRDDTLGIPDELKYLGKVECREKGREEGFREAIERISRNMLDGGYDISDIIDITGIAYDKLKLFSLSSKRW